MKTLSPLNGKFAIAYPASFTEFEVQAWLYGQLRAMGLDVRGEVRWRNPETGEACRFDLVIFDRGVASEIIEVKDTGRHDTSRPVERTRQCHRYRHFGVPVTFIYEMKDAQAYVRNCAAQKRAA